MGTGKEVSVPALRGLTYTVLIKAAVSAVMFFCASTVLFELFTVAPDRPVIGLLYAVIQTVGFISAVACVMCLDEISALSKHFVSAQRLMAAGLIAQCLLLLMSMLRMHMGIGANAEKFVYIIIMIIMLAFVAVEKLLTGAAFLFMIKGFCDAVKECGAAGQTRPLERLGAVYFYFNVAIVIVAILLVSNEETVIFSVAAADYLVSAILEFLMYRRVSDAAFIIWRKRAFKISDQQGD